MRKLIVSNFVTPDGYYEGLGRQIDSLFDYNHSDYAGDPTFEQYSMERLLAADFLLLSRTAFLGNQGFWSQLALQPQATAVQHAIAQRMRAIEKIVISDHLAPTELSPWENTRVLPRAAAYEEIAALKRQAGGDILVSLSRRLWNDLLVHDLVDELHLIYFSSSAEADTALFEGHPPVSLKLINIRSWEGSDNVLACYQPSRKQA